MGTDRQDLDSKEISFIGIENNERSTVERKESLCKSTNLYTGNGRF